MLTLEAVHIVTSGSQITIPSSMLDDMEKKLLGGLWETMSLASEHKKSSTGRDEKKGL